MVSILPMVDLLGNTAVDWFCILSYFRLDTLVDGHEAFFPDIYTQMYPDGTRPSIPPQGRDLGKIPIFKLSHGTHSPQAYEIEPHGDHSDHYIFKPNIKLGRKEI